MSEFEPVTQDPEEIEPTPEVDPSDGIYEGDAQEVLAENEIDPVEEYVDSERVVEVPDDVDDEEEL